MIEVVYNADSERAADAAEEMVALLTDILDLQGQLLDASEKTEEEVEKVEKAVSNWSKAQKVLQKDIFETTGAAKALIGSGKALAKIGGAASAALTGAAIASLKVSQAGTDQEKVNQRLSNSLLAVSKDAAEAEKRFGDLQGLIGDQAVATDFGDEEVADTLAKLIATTGDYKAAQEDLSTVLGVVEQRGKSAEEVTNQLAKARKGDLEALKELTPLNAEQIKTLQKETNAAKRGAMAMEILRSQYKGAADTAGTAGNAIKNNTDAQGDYVQMLGMVLNASGAVQALLGPITKGIRGQESAVKDNNVELQKMVLTVAEGVVGALEVTTEVLVFGYKAWKDLQLGVSFAATGLKAIPPLAEIVGRSLLVLGADVLGFVLEKLGSFSEQAEEIARAVGADGIADALSQASKVAREFDKDLDALAKGQLKEIAEEVKEVDTAVKDLNDDVGDWVQGYKDAESAGDKVRAVTDGMRAELAKANANVKDIGDGFKLANIPAGDLADNVNKIAEDTGQMSAAELALRMRLAEIQKQILQAKDDEAKGRVLNLELEKATVEAELDKLGAKNKVLGQLEKENALLEARQVREEGLTALLDERLQKVVAQDVTALRIAAFQTEDTLQRALLEIEADRRALDAQDLTDEEKKLELLKLERAEQEAITAAREKEAAAMREAFGRGVDGAADGLALGAQTRLMLVQEESQERLNELREIGTDQAKEEAEQIKRLVELEQQRAAALTATTDSVAMLAQHLADASAQNWDLVKGQESYVGAMVAAGQIAQGVSSLAIKDRAKLAGVEATIQYGLGIGATAAFIQSGGLAFNYAAAAAQHFTSAGALTVAASRGGQAAGLPSGGASASASAGGSSAGRASSSAPSIDFERERRETAKMIGEEVRGRNNTATPGNYIDMRGALIMADSPEGQRMVGQGTLRWLERTGVLPQQGGLTRG